MHSVLTYPMKDEDANLNMIKTLRDKFNCDVGYSGHEVGLAVSYAAAALGIHPLKDISLWIELCMVLISLHQLNREV